MKDHGIKQKGGGCGDVIRIPEENTAFFREYRNPKLNY